MSEPATYMRSGAIGKIVMNDGKANVMSLRMLSALHAAFDRAEADQVVALLTGRGGCFSAGFDLKVFAQGSARDIHALLRSGAELAHRVLSFPAPVLTACTGHAYPMGAFLMLSADLRLGADGPFRIGMNEVAIGIPVPGFAIEVARQRLTPAYFNRATTTGEMFSPSEAVVAGFLDRVIPVADLAAAADVAAEQLAKLNRAAHYATKLRARAPALAAIRAAIESELTLENAQRAVARRSAG